VKRNTWRRDQHRAAIKANEPPCHLCGRPIDYDLHHMHPLAFVVDHIVPLARGGADTLENKSAAHRACNSAKAARLLGEQPRPRRHVDTFKTERAW
jgi:5-methylcytosine-specific restriction endonuclease McrA